MGVLQLAGALADFLEERMIVIDVSGVLKRLAERDLSVQDLNRTRAERDETVFTSLGGELPALLRRATLDETLSQAL